MSDMYRTRTMDQISEGDIGAQLKIAGWVENIRVQHLSVWKNGTK